MLKTNPLLPTAPLKSAARRMFLSSRRRRNYQRTGLESEYYEILGVNIPSTSIPVSPGRNLAVVLETAAINNRQKRMGYNAAKELLIRLGLDGTVE